MMTSSEKFERKTGESFKTILFDSIKRFIFNASDN